MAGRETMRARREREAAMFADADETMRNIVFAVARADGLGAWCTAKDVAYTRIIAWIESDPIRAQALDAAFRARADLAGGAIEAIARNLSGDVAEHPWVGTRMRPTRNPQTGEVDGEEPVELDSKAARVAMAGFQWLAEKGDRTKFGKVTEHHHTHAVQFEHLAALRAHLAVAPLTRSLPPPAGPVYASERAMDALDAEFTMLFAGSKSLITNEQSDLSIVERIGLRRTLRST